MRLWRISAYPGLSGIGGTYADGRWHTRPRAVLYAAEHPALAMLEVLANMHLTATSLPINLRLIAIDVAPRAKRADAPELPDGWQANRPATQVVGNRWLDARDDLLLPVPSSLVGHAANYLVNPLHPQAATHLKEIDQGPCWVDPRFIR
jgi:RES domain-containing protein